MLVFTVLEGRWLSRLLLGWGGELEIEQVKMSQSLSILLRFSLFSFFLSFWESTCMWRRGRERESQAGSTLTVWIFTFHLYFTDSVEPYAGLDLTNCEIMTWTETKSQTLNWPSCPGTPQPFFSNKLFSDCHNSLTNFQSCEKVDSDNFCKCSHCFYWDFSEAHSLPVLLLSLHRFFQCNLSFPWHKLLFSKYWPPKATKCLDLF